MLVLPYADHTAAGDQEYFCQGIAQEIIHALAGVKAIRLVAWGSAPGASGAAGANGATPRPISAKSARDSTPP